LAKIYNNEEIAYKYADTVEKYCREFDLDSKLVSRLIFKESKFLKYKKSYGYSNEVVNSVKYFYSNGLLTTNMSISTNKVKYIIACGPMMVRPLYWSHLLYKTNSDLYKKLKESKNPDADHIRYLCTIDHGIRTGCDILRYYLNLNKENYPFALTKYWAGKNSKQFKKLKNKGMMNHYVLDIAYSELEGSLLKYFPTRWDFYKVPPSHKREIYKNHKEKLKKS
jgi:hypothetical protein